MPEMILTIESIVLAALAWPLFRVMTMPAFRHQFPGVFAIAAVALITWIGLIVAVALILPEALHSSSALAAMVMAAATWRARPNYGRGRHLPPGSLALASSIEAIVDREFYRKQAALHGPVFKMSQFHRPVVCIIGLERGHRLMREHRDALGASPLPFNREIPHGFLRYMDARAHAHYGPLFRQATAASVMESALPVVRRAIELELIAAAGGKGISAGGLSTARPDDMLNRIVFVSFMRALFGLDPDSGLYRQFTAAYEPLSELALNRKLSSRHKAAMSELRRLLSGLSAQWRSSGAQTPVPVCSLSELSRLDPRMPDTTCLDNLIFILRIATSNVVGLLRWVMVLLAANPHWVSRLREGSETGVADAADPNSSKSATALVDRIIMETLRLRQSEYLYRTLEDAVEFDGWQLPRGWLVRLCVRESHRDEEEFDRPEQFDPDRFLGTRYSHSQYSPFGFGQHACNGVALTQLISRTFIEQLSTRYDWSLLNHEKRTRRFRHWEHWRPSPDLQLTLKPLVDPDRANATDHG